MFTNIAAARLLFINKKQEMTDSSSGFNLVFDATHHHFDFVFILVFLNEALANGAKFKFYLIKYDLFFSCLPHSIKVSIHQFLFEER